MESKKEPFEKRAVRLPDGRRLVFYDFPVAAPRDSPPRDPPPRQPAERPASEER